MEKQEGPERGVGGVAGEEEEEQGAGAFPLPSTRRALHSADVWSTSRACESGLPPHRCLLHLLP